MAAATITEADMAKLLGRPLTSNESTNFALYLEISKEHLETLLGLKLDGDAAAERAYPARDGFQSLVVDPFSVKDSLEVKLDDEVVTDFVVRQNDDYNASGWFNTIEFVKPMCRGLYKVKATWGYGTTLPAGIKTLWAGLFGVIGSGQAINTDVEEQKKSETTLSHSVTYDTSKPAADRFAAANAMLIAKYSQKNQINFTSGRTHHPYGAHR